MVNGGVALWSGQVTPPRPRRNGPCSEAVADQPARHRPQGAEEGNGAADAACLDLM